MQLCKYPFYIRGYLGRYGKNTKASSHLSPNIVTLDSIMESIHKLSELKGGGCQGVKYSYLNRGVGIGGATGHVA